MLGSWSSDVGQRGLELPWRWFRIEKPRREFCRISLTLTLPSLVSIHPCSYHLYLRLITYPSVLRAL